LQFFFFSHKLSGNENEMLIKAGSLAAVLTMRLLLITVPGNLKSFRQPGSARPTCFLGLCSGSQTESPYLSGSCGKTVASGLYPVALRTFAAAPPHLAFLQKINAMRIR